MSWGCAFEKVTAQHVIKNSYLCCANLMFLTIFTTAHHFSSFLTRLTSSTIFHPVSLVSTLILSYLCSGLPSHLFSSGFPIKILNVNIVRTVRYLVINSNSEPYTHQNICTSDAIKFPTFFGKSQMPSSGCHFSRQLSSIFAHGPFCRRYVS